MFDICKIKKIYLYFILILCHFISALADQEFNHHVICSLKHHHKDSKHRKKCNDAIHKATYALNCACKKKYKQTIEVNQYYQHRRDTVFFIHFDHKFHTWTLYKPSFIPYKDFVKLAHIIYSQHGLQVKFSQDQKITTTAQDKMLSHAYLTLDQFEQYKDMSKDQFEEEIAAIKSSHDDGDQAQEKIEQLKKIQKMQQFFFWHLQIPLVGLMPSRNFDIDDAYKPLAWHFLLWDLAPKKGQGARVAIIDTGASAFNIAEKEFADMYKKNINIRVPNVLQDYGYNLVSQGGLDPIRQIAINFGNFCDHEKFNSDEIMEKLPECIIELIKNKTKSQFEQYFIKNAKKEYLKQSGDNLNQKGEDVLKNLLYGKYGVMPFEKNSFFNIVKLSEPYNEEVLLETLPAPKLQGNDDPIAAGHGTFTQGIVNAQINNNLGISGLAPQADVIMIKAFNDRGTTNKTTLNIGLQRAVSLQNSIVSMSLKITDEIDKVADAPLKELIDSIDYVVAASGNDGATEKLAYKEAYPAKFDSVAFDVGAFSYDQGEYSICKFTQKELLIGPKFAAPGFNIFSTGLTPDQTTDSMYLFMTGTSIAVPIITGFIALVHAEFQDVFTREQILKVIYKFSMKLNNDDIWQKYIKVGMPDMRSALLCLHVLKSLKNYIQEHDLSYNFVHNFNNLVQAIYTINYHVPSWYEQQVNISCTQNFAGYSKAVQGQSASLTPIKFFTPHNLESCIDFIQTLILNAKTPKSAKSIKKSSKTLDNELQKILYNKNLNLFAHLSVPAQNRINKALTPRIPCTNLT